MIENSVDKIFDGIRAYNMDNAGTELHELRLDDRMGKLQMAHMPFIGKILLERSGQPREDQLPQVKNPMIAAGIFATFKIEAILKGRT